EGTSMSRTLVAGGIIYHSTSNIVYAFDEASGRILWQQHTDNQAIYFTLGSVVDDVLYADTSTMDPLVGGECNNQPPALVCLESTYHVYAFDARKGTLLWKSAPGLHLYSNNYLSVNDTNQPGEADLPVVSGVVLAYQHHG